MAEPIDPSEQLALQLMQLELKEVQSGLKGKGHADEPDDFALALQLQMFQIDSQIRILQDREYCRQFFAQPNRENHAVGTATQTEPTTAAAAGPSGQSTASSAASTPLSTPATSVVEAADDGQPESSKSAALRTQETSEAADDGLEQVCAACSEPLGDELAVSAPCGHNYCPDCLTCLFESAITDESLFPPRCCKQPILLDSTKKWLPEELIIEFESKALEFTTLDRTYCSNVQCSLFVPPRQIVSDRGYCESCEQWTCTICKNPEHGGMCPDDPCRAEILAVAKENGWQQCYGCKQLIELKLGCNHMTCRCGSQFCYECGEKWRTCTCKQWSESLLLERAEQLVNRGMFGGNSNAGAVREARRHIQQTHACWHRSWSYRSGGGRCEECRDHLPTFLFECEGCNIRACKRCKLNRL